MGRIVRAEWYRLVHGKSFLIALVVLAALIVGSNLMNSSLASLGEESLAKTMDSFTGGLPTFFMAIMAISLAQADRQAGTLKNVVSCGIPRSKVFLGKLVSAFIVTLIIIAVSGVVSYAAALATGASGTIRRGRRSRLQSRLRESRISWAACSCVRVSPSMIPSS